MILKAPAKLNLWLRITGRRPNGYHELESLFTCVSLFDDISIEEAHNSVRSSPGSAHSGPAPDRSDRRDAIESAAPGASDVFGDRIIYRFGENQESIEIPNDTVTKAVTLFRQLLKPTPYLEIEITKRIPMGAGLGGGSSDAAAVLAYLHKTYSLQTAPDRVSEIAAQVGADVPFFLKGGAALVSGIGDVVKPVRIPRMAVVIIRPDFGISTPEAYAWFDMMKGWPNRATGLPKNSAPNDHSNHETHAQSGVSRLTRLVSDATPTVFDEAFGLAETTQVVASMVNDLEKPVESRHPEISEMKKALRKWGALSSLMSGSGSSVYGIFNGLIEAQRACDNLKQELPASYSFFVCETA